MIVLSVTDFEDLIGIAQRWGDSTCRTRVPTGGHMIPPWDNVSYALRIGAKLWRCWMKRIMLLLVLSSFSFPAYTQTQGRAYLEQAHIFGRAEEMEIEAEMVIESPQGASRRRLHSYIARTAEDSSLFAQITEPAFLRNMRILVIQSSSGPEEKWLATSHGVRRLSNNQGDTRVFGSHFTAEDLSFLDPEELEVTAFEERETSGTVIISVETGGNDLMHRVFTVDTMTELIREVSYRTRDGREVRQYRVLSTQQISGTTVPRVSEMRDLLSGERTVLEFQQVEVGKRIPARVFSRGNL